MQVGQNWKHVERLSAYNVSEENAAPSFTQTSACWAVLACPASLLEAVKHLCHEEEQAGHDKRG